MNDKLHADGPSSALADELRVFGQFVGTWKLQWHGNDLAGVPIVVAGELVFDWILSGTAIQDVWRVPVDVADRGRMRAFHGTTIRFYDQRIRGWRSTWIDPVNGRVRRFIGRLENGCIILDGLDDDPMERWSFRDITPDSFVWRGEASVDGGQSWIVEDEMFARRCAAT